MFVAAAVLAVAWLLLGPASLHPMAPPGELCIQHLDVGQGDSVLLSLPQGERILVDGGGIPGSRYDVGLHRVVPALRRAGVTRLDAVVATHADADHIAGLFAVFEELEVDVLVVYSRKRMRGTLRSLVALAKRSGAAVHAVDEGGLPALVAAPGRIEWHRALPGADSDWTENDRSVVLSVGLGDIVALLSGDIEHTAEAALVAAGTLPRSAILKVPHHASRTSSSAAFLDRVAPLVGLAGVGEGNRFGFPHASTSARYLGRGIPLYWTGRHGALRACTDGWTLDVETFDRGGRRSVLRSWSAEEVSGWLRDAPDAVGLGSIEHPTTERSRPSRKGRTKRPREGTSRKRAKRKKVKRSKKKSDPGKEAATPTDPLLDDKAWKKRRRKRGKLRAPWK